MGKRLLIRTWALATRCVDDDTRSVKFAGSARTALRLATASLESPSQGVVPVPAAEEDDAPGVERPSRSRCCLRSERGAW